MAGGGHDGAGGGAFREGSTGHPTLLCVLLAFPFQVYLLWENTMPPSILQSDNGTEFCNGILNQLCEMYGVRHICGSVGHPQSQGCVERANMVVKDKLRGEIGRDSLAGRANLRCGGVRW